jgi:hypothetical protein
LRASGLGLREASNCEEVGPYFSNCEEVGPYFMLHACMWSLFHVACMHACMYIMYGTPINCMHICTFFGGYYFRDCFLYMHTSKSVLYACTHVHSGMLKDL